MDVKLRVYVSDKKITYGKVPENVALGIINATLLTLITDDDAELVGYCVNRRADNDSIELHLDFTATTKLERDKNIALVTNIIVSHVIEFVCFLSTDIEFAYFLSTD